MTVVARLAVRAWRNTYNFWVSDACLVLGLLNFTILGIGELVIILRGQTDYTQYYSEGYAKWKYASSILFDVGFYFPRFSLLAFYHELFPISEPRLRTWLRIAITYTTAGFLNATFMDILWCGSDLSRNWSNVGQRCSLTLSTTPMYVNWAVGISCEIFILLLPVPLLGKLKKLGKGEKVAFACVLLLGIVTVAVSTTRFTLMVMSMLGSETYLLGYAEIGTQIMVVALPTLRPLLSHTWTRSATKRCKSSAVAARRDFGARKSDRESTQNTSSTISENVSGDFVDPESCAGGKNKIQLIYAEGNPTSRYQPPWELIELPHIDSTLNIEGIRTEGV